jgi:hypothetical protein
MSIDKAKRLRQDFEEDCRKRAKLYRYLGVLGAPPLPWCSCSGHPVTAGS